MEGEHSIRVDKEELFALGGRKNYKRKSLQRRERGKRT